MREIRVRFSVPDGDLHDWGGDYGMDDICPLAVHRVEMLSDGTVAAVVGFEGDHRPVRDALANDEMVEEYSVTPEADGLFLVQFEPRETVRDMLRARRETAVRIQLPFALNADGSVTATFLGDDATVTEALEFVPAPVDAEILRLRDVAAPDRSVFDRLTDRQREVLDAAVDAGYYDDPRGATHEELAATLDVAPTTVSEHLRRIERRVFAAYGSEP